MGECTDFCSPTRQQSPRQPGVNVINIRISVLRPFQLCGFNFRQSLGFFLNISNTSNPSCVHKPFDEDEFTHIHTVKFECQVGCPLKASYFFSKVNQCEIDENTGTAKYKKVKRLIGMRRAWKYEKIDEDLEIV